MFEDWRLKVNWEFGRYVGLWFIVVIVKEFVFKIKIRGVVKLEG